MRLDKFQLNVATGRLTLPVVILICLLIWCFTLESWNNLATLALSACVGYLMIETNTAFTLIRTRTTFFISLYWYLFSSFLFLHPFKWSQFTTLAFVLAMYHLFRSYESSHASGKIFYAAFFLAIGSLCFPPLLYFTPIFLFSALIFGSLNIKSFVAFLLGIIGPYWILFFYAFYSDEMHLFLAPLKALTHFSRIDYTCFPVNEWVSCGFTTFILLVSSIHYFTVSYQDKTRTRSFMSFLIIIGYFTTLFIILQPHHMHEWLPIQLLSASYLTAHLFTLTRNRFTGIFFMITFVCLISLTYYNIWTQFFSF